VNVRVAGVASTLPAGSTAATVNVCDPLLSALVVSGEVHTTNAPPSMLHLNVEPSSLEVNPNVGVVSLVVPPFGGPASIVVFGATVSMVKLRVAGLASTLLPKSTAATDSVWAPSESDVVVNGEAQGVAAPPSIEQTNVGLGSLAGTAAKLNVGVLSFVRDPAAGPAVIVVSGGVESAALATSPDTPAGRLAGLVSSSSVRLPFARRRTC